MTLGKGLVAAGVVLVIAGILVQSAPALRLGRLPGDFSFGGNAWRVYVPLGTSIVLSILLTVAFAVANAVMRR